MNWIRDNLRWLAILLFSLLATGAALTIWQQRSANTQLQLQLNASNTQRDALSVQLDTAQLTIGTKDGQIGELTTINRQQAEDVKAQLQRLDTITRNATARAAKLEAILNEDQDAKRWGDTRLPAAIARLLDTTQAAGDPAGPPDRAATLPAGGGLPTAGRQPEDQPPAGAKPAGNPPSP
ncbi:hypothetical protein JW897_17735 [Chromobacterium alkanivorans]|nr:hypothetical protein [Chromobacterium alkanivorans]MBN3005577.1 hypothetical protein [Chromobacterium alkanivorans]